MIFKWHYICKQYFPSSLFLCFFVLLLCNNMCRSEWNIFSLHKKKSFVNGGGGGLGARIVTQCTLYRSYSGYSWLDNHRPISDTSIHNIDTIHNAYSVVSIDYMYLILCNTDTQNSGREKKALNKKSMCNKQKALKFDHFS